MKTQIKKMSQDLNLETGTIANYVVLELPDGKMIRAEIDEAGAHAVTVCIVQHTAVPLPKIVEDVPPDLPEERPDTVVFGGPKAPKSQFLGADEYGYPIVSGGAPPAPDAPSWGGDEDGVGQV